MIKRKYHCTQYELYEVCRLGWNKFLSLISLFNSLKTMYNGAFFNARITEIDNAEAMPDDRVRSAVVSEQRRVLEIAGEFALSKWRDLKAYINTAYNTDFAMRDLKIKEAGGDLYEEGAHENWEVLMGLMDDGALMIGSNYAVLVANNNMPGGFPTIFVNAKIDFQSKMNAFYLAEAGAGDVGSDKVDANNMIHTKLMEMLGDAQQVFEGDEEQQKQFTFNYLLNLISNRLGGMKGLVSEGTPATVIAGAEVTIEELNQSAITNSEGRYDEGVVKSGTYTVTVIKTGFVTQTISGVVIEAGVTKTLDVVLIRE